jgi:hypothetical protein
MLLCDDGMTEHPYSNREIDALAERLGDKINAGVEHLADRIAGFEKDTRESLSRVETQVAYTNGKVKKITVALVLLAGMMIGLGFDKAPLLLSLIGI